jgi:hypothetical protein
MPNRKGSQPDSLMTCRTIFPGSVLPSGFALGISLLRKLLLGESRGGIHTAATREAGIAIIEATAQNDPILKAGVETAPHYKWRVRREGIYNDGIPVGSIILADWDD